MFDMGGVIANSSNTDNICKELNISNSDYYLYQLDSEGRNTYQQLSLGLISTTDYWDNFSRNSNKEISVDYFKTLYKPMLNYFLFSRIMKIKENNTRVVCATNTIKSHFDEHHRLGHYAIFDFIYSSHLLGVKKPNPEFFNKIIDAEQALAEDIFFIDDNKINIEAAKNIGIKTHLFVSNQNFKVE